MMKKFILSLFSLFVSLITLAQPFPMEFGSVSIGEVKMEKYAPEPDAEALVLFDLGKSYFSLEDNSFDVIFERSMRIKIFNSAGLDWANIEIPFYREGTIFEKIYDLEAYTYNYEDGTIKKTMLNQDNCFKEKQNEFWWVLKFAMPEVKEGSVIEFRYKLSSQYVSNLRDWDFQFRIPNLYSSYEVRLIPFYQYMWIMQGASKFHSQTSVEDTKLTQRFAGVEYKDMIHTFVMKDIPSFADEGYITSMNDYVIRLDFQLSKINYPNGIVKEIKTTWPLLIKDLLKHEDFGKVIKKSQKFLKQIDFSKDFENLNEKERFDAILRYVKTNYSWDKNYGKYASKDPNKLLKDKFGSSADINLFTIGLLKEAGIETNPVLISTRSHGKIKGSFPFNHFFNNVVFVSSVDQKLVLSDATNALLPNNRLPIECINDAGLVINDEKEEWIPTQYDYPSQLDNFYLHKFENEVQIIQTKTKATEYFAYHFRSAYGENKEKIKEAIQKTSTGLIENSIEILNAKEVTEPYQLKYTLSNPPTEINSKLYISPFSNEVITDNPFKQNSREYPIDFEYAVYKSYTASIVIPEGYSVDYLPEETTINNDLVEIEYKVLKSENNISLQFSYYFKKAVYPAKDYGKLKFYFKEIIKLGSEKCVLSKQ